MLWLLYISCTRTLRFLMLCLRDELPIFVAVLKLSTYSFVFPFKLPTTLQRFRLLIHEVIDPVFSSCEDFANISIRFYIPGKIGNLFKTVLETSIWMLYICQKDVWTASWFPYFAFWCFYPCSGWVMNQTSFDTPFSQNILWAMGIFPAQPRKLTWQWKNTIFHRRYIFQTRCVSIVMFVFGGEKRHLFTNQDLLGLFHEVPTSISTSFGEHGNVTAEMPAISAGDQLWQVVTSGWRSFEFSCGSWEYVNTRNVITIPRDHVILQLSRCFGCFMTFLLVVSSTLPNNPFVSFISSMCFQNGASWGGSFLAACASQAQALKASPVWATEEIWVQLEKAPEGNDGERRVSISASNVDVDSRGEFQGYQIDFKYWWWSNVARHHFFVGMFWHSSWKMWISRDAIAPLIFHNSSN